MYISKIRLHNIRAIQELELDFKAPYAGWHVLLGDNGVGKSSVLRAIAVGLIGPVEILRLDPAWQHWVRLKNEKATITVDVIRNNDIDRKSGRGASTKEERKSDPVKGILEIATTNGVTSYKITDVSPKKPNPNQLLWGTGGGWFSIGIGAFRRFTGGLPTLERMFDNAPRPAAHMTLFREDAALSETMVWIYELLRYRDTNGYEWATETLEGIESFLKGNDLLPHGFDLSRISAEGLFFIDQQETEIHLYELSKGIKSVLSLVMELLRNLCSAYGHGEVFENAENHYVKCEGVVLIDEVDVHLHPSWQTKIGTWFTKTFPNIQFIVTTHSPLICRSCDKNSIIWQLKAYQKGVPVEGTQREQLIYGNILDAFGTDLFGENIERSAEGQKKLERYSFLSQKLIFDKNSTDVERAEFENLEKIFQTDAPNNS